MENKALNERSELKAFSFKSPLWKSASPTGGRTSNLLTSTFKSNGLVNMIFTGPFSLVVQKVVQKNKKDNTRMGIKLITILNF